VRIIGHGFTPAFWRADCLRVGDCHPGETLPQEKAERYATDPEYRAKPSHPEDVGEGEGEMTILWSGNHLSV
jgi:hypothetical protein